MDTGDPLENGVPHLTISNMPRILNGTGRTSFLAESYSQLFITASGDSIVSSFPIICGVVSGVLEAWPFFFWEND